MSKVLSLSITILIIIFEPHLHVYEIGNKGRGTRIGENAKPLKGQQILTPKESKVVAKYKSKIKKECWEDPKVSGSHEIWKCLRKETMKKLQGNNVKDSFIWVFNGDHGQFPSAIFREKNDAIQWIQDNSLSGILTRYPVDVPLFDWAIENGFFTPKNELQQGAKTKANFSSSHLEHYHFVCGE